MKNFKIYFKFDAAPKDIYKALTNNEIMELWSGAPANMKEEAGSEFSMWNDSICGKNLEFEKDFKIVQEWYFGDQKESSIVTIKLHPDKKGTSMEVRQINIPEEAYDNVSECWTEGYYDGISEMYNE